MDELQKLYNALSNEYDLGDFNSFESRMQTPEQRKRFYDAISNEGLDLGDYNQYENRLKKKEDPSDVTSPMEPMDSTLPQEGTSGLSESEELVETEFDVADQFEGMPLFKKTPDYLIDKDKQKELADLENKKFVENIDAQSNKIAESYADELDNEFYAQEEVVKLINEANRKSKNEVQAFVDTIVSSGIDPTTDKSKKQIQDYYSLIFDKELSSDEKFDSLVSSYSDVRADKVFNRVKQYQSSASKAKKAKDLMDNPIYETLSKIPVAKNLLDGFLLSDGLVGEASSAFMYGKPASKELVPVAEASAELKKDRARLAKMDVDGIDEVVEYLPSSGTGAPPSKIKFTRSQVLDRIQSRSDEISSLSPEKINRALDLQKISQFLSPKDQFLEGDFTLESLGGLVGQQLANQVEVPILGTYALELGASYLDTVKEIAEYKYGEASAENIIKVIDSGEDGAAELSAAAHLSATIDAFGLVPIGKGASIAVKGAIKSGSKTASKTASETFKKNIIVRVKKQIKENIKDKIKNKAARKFIGDSYQVVKGSLIGGLSEFPLETTQSLIVSEAGRKTIEEATGQELETDIEGALKEGGTGFIVASLLPFTAGSLSIAARVTRDVYKSSKKSLAEKARRKIQEKSELKSKDYLVNESPKTRVEINEIIENANTPEDLDGISINNDKGIEDKLVAKAKELQNAVQEQETREVPDAEQAEGVQEVEIRREQELEPIRTALAMSEQTGEIAVVNGEPVTKQTLNNINAKYDAELKALEESTQPTEVETEVREPDVETEESVVIDETELSELEAEVLDAESEGTIDENLGEVVYMDDGTPGMLQIDPENENTYSIVTNDNIIEVGLKSEDGGSKTLAEIGVSKFPPEGVKTEPKTAKGTTAVSIDGVEYDVIGRRRDKKGQAVVKVKEKGTGLIRRFKGEKAERILKDVSLQEDAPTPSIDLRTEGKEVVSKKKKDEVENFTEQQLQEEIDRVERESKEFEESLEKDIEAEEALDRKLMFSTRTGDVSVTRNTDGSYRVSKKSPSGKYVALREKTERENAIREYEKIRKERGDKRLSDAVELAQEFKKEQDDKVVSWLDKQISATSTKGKAFDAVRGIPQFMLHEGLKMVKSAYLAGKSLKQAVDDSIKFIKSQGYSVNEIQYKKAILDGLKEPQRVQEKQPKRDDNKVSDEKPKKAAPSARKVTGQPKRKKVTVDEYASLKDQIKLEAKAARESVTAYKNAGKKIAEAVKALGGKVKLTVRQANTVAKKILRTNLTNDKQVKGLLEYLEKIYQRAELSDMIVNARKRKKRAKANLKSKVGPDGVLLGKLREMVSLDPTDVPLDLLPEYAEFMDRLGASSKVLDLPQKRDALDLATRILERVEDSFDNTLTETSSPKDYNLDEAVKEIQSEKIDVSNISNPDAKKLAEFINGLTKKDIEGLVESKDGKKDYSKVENLKSLKREMNKGYAPTFAQEVKTKVKSNRVVDNLSGRPLANTNKGTNVLNFLDKAVYGTIKGLLRGTKAIEEVLRATPFVGTSLDNALGNYNRSDFRRQVVDPIARAYESLTNEFRSIREDYLERAEYVLSRNGIEMRDNNSILKSKYKIQTFLLQLEFLSNMKLDKDGVNTNTQVAPAIGFINETIAKMKSEEGVLKDGRIKILEEIRDEFSENGEISIEKIEQSLSDGEKEATYLIQQAYSQTNEKYQYLASVVRGEGVKPLNNYVHHNVMYDKARDEKDAMSEKSKKFVTASTKSGTVLQRTPGAKAINFDPISSASKGINDMLTDYHMTEPVKVALSITNKLKSIEGLSENQQNAMNALDNVLKESLDKVFMNTMTSNTVFDKFLESVDKYGYYAALASVPRAGAELGSNFIGALTMSPKTFTAGIANFGNFSMGQNVEGFLRAVQSSSTNRLAPESGSLGKFGDGTTFSKGERASGAMNPVLNKANWIAKNARIPQLRKLLDAVPEKLLMTPDLAISRPVFFQSFADKFQELTGKKLTVEDYIAIANGDMSSIEGNMDAVADARDFADTQVKRLAASANPFEKPLKNIIGVDDSGMKKVYKRANSYMANFFAFEFNTASEAIIAVFNTGEISRRQAFGLLGMVGARMSAYLVTYKVLSSLFDEAISELFGIDIGEEEEEDLLGMSVRQAVGSAATLMLRRRMGSLSSLPAMYGLEYVNEEYLQVLRDGEDYESYKHNLAFTPIPMDELSKMNPAEVLFMTLSGPQGPMLKSGLRAAKLMQRGTEEAMDELENRMIIEAAGNINLIPFYKDTRRILLKNQFKDYGKESLWKKVERDNKEYEKIMKKRDREQNKFIKSFNKGFETDGFKGGGFKGGGF